MVALKTSCNYQGNLYSLIQLLFGNYFIMIEIFQEMIEGTQIINTEVIKNNEIELLEFIINIMADAYF